MAFCSECGNLYDITNTSPETVTSSEENTSSGKKSSTNKKMFFICTTCGNMEQMKPRTHIVGKQSDEIAKEYHSSNTRPENLVHVPVLFHTRDYICPNPSCETQKSPEKRDAIMNRIGNSYKMQYTCTLCLTSWK